MSDDQRSAIRSAAARFLDAAFAALSEEHVLPTARYHPHIRVGRDYFGDTIHALPEHHELERILANEFPERFSDEVALMRREFAASYIFNFLEGAVAHGTPRGEFDSSSTASAEAIDELVAALTSRSRGDGHPAQSSSATDNRVKRFAHRPRTRPALGCQSANIA